MKFEKKLSFIFIFVFSIFFCCFVLWILYEFINVWSQKRKNIINYAKEMHNNIKQIILFHSHFLQKKDNIDKNLQKHSYSKYLKYYLKHLTVNTNTVFISIILPDKEKEILKINPKNLTINIRFISKKEVFLPKDGIIIISNNFKLPYSFLQFINRKSIFKQKNKSEKNSSVEVKLITGVNVKKISIEQQGDTALLFILIFSLSFGFFIAIITGWYYSVRYKTISGYLETMKSREEEFREFSLIATGLTHETKNPLGIIRGLAQQIFNTENIPKIIRSRAEQIMEQADVTTARLGDFLSYAKVREPKLSPVKIRTLIFHIKELITSDIETANVKFEIICEDTEILADEEMLSQLLMNLILNSLKFVSKGDFIKIILKRNLKKDNASLIIEDSGKGIPEDILPNIFKPYVSKSTSGYGIGLAIVKRIAEKSGWNIKIESKENKGTRVIISNIKLVKKKTT